MGLNKSAIFVWILPIASGVQCGHTIMASYPATRSLKFTVDQTMYFVQIRLPTQDFRVRRLMVD